MKLKKVVSLIAVSTMVVSSLAGCGDKKEKTKETAVESAPATDSGESDTKEEAKEEVKPEEQTEKNYDKEITLEFFDAAANNQGEQTGWFAKILKDKFNIKLNVIAPQQSGNAAYTTRVSDGNLGDLVLLDRTDFADCVTNGLIKDISDTIGNCKSLSEYKTQIDEVNKGLPGNEAGNTFAIPCQMTNTSATSYSQDVIYSSPLLRWDLYNEVGAPEIKDTEGLLDVLEKIQKAHPTNEDGDPAYALSLWADWDGGDGMLGIANAIQLTTWYGEKGKGALLLQPDNTFKPITDKTAAYYKTLHFLNEAYRRGLVDPDSGTQDWNAACDKMTKGRVYLMWYSWQVGFWNTTDRLNNGTGFIFVPVGDQSYYADADTYYGSGRLIGVGSKVDDEKYSRIMDFLDWYASPEGCMVQHNGIEGFNYEKGEDGRLYQKNDNALMDNLPVPEEYGGGGYQDGNNAINQWIVDASSKNPITGEPYATQYWSTYKEATMNQMKKDWEAKFGAKEPAEWMQKNNKLIISPNVCVSLPGDTNDISVIRSQCNDTLNDYSWRMIFAKDDKEFDKMWDEMTTQMKGFGFDDLCKFDQEKHQIEVDAKIKAAGN